MIQLNEIVKGRWFSKDGTEFALRDNSSSVDQVDRCGVGFVALPESDPITDACKVHDYAYSSPAYQAFHTRAEADAELVRLAKMVEGSLFSWAADILGALASAFGKRYWENKKTR